MNFLVLAFVLSLVITLGLIRYQHLHERVTNDCDLSGPQKFHTHAVPRIGGIGIALSIFITSLIAFFFFSLERGVILLQLIACALPCFLVGLAEDLTKRVSIKIRLITTTTSAFLASYLFNIWINQIQVIGFDYMLAITWISVFFTLLAITGLVNAYNIIDGFNGLASMVAIISFLAIGFIAFKVNDLLLASICLIIVGSIGGFFTWNYPRGLIFLGDGGAYLIGFLIATISILLVKRNPPVSPWFPLLVNAYPIFETLFTIWRRRIHQGKNPGLPDGAHFHSLIYRRLIRWAEVNNTKDSASYSKNAKTSPYLWILSCIGIFPGIIWWDKTWVLQCATLLFCILYIWIYNAIVTFKTPNILKKLK